MSIMDSWSERVGDALEQAQQDLLTHCGTCPSCKSANLCADGATLTRALELAEQDFQTFIDYDEV